VNGDLHRISLHEARQHEALDPASGSRQNLGGFTLAAHPGRFASSIGV